MLAANNTDIYWDIDSAFLNNNQQAGTFIRKYTSEWKYYQTHQIKTVSSNFDSEKKHRSNWCF